MPARGITSRQLKIFTAERVCHYIIAIPTLRWNFSIINRWEFTVTSTAKSIREAYLKDPYRLVFDLEPLSYEFTKESDKEYTYEKYARLILKKITNLAGMTGRGVT